MLGLFERGVSLSGAEGMISRSTAIHEAAHLVASVLLMPDQHFIVQVGDTGAPGMDAAVVRRNEWKQAPSSMNRQQLVNRMFDILIGALAGPIAEARHRECTLATVYLDAGGFDMAQAAEICEMLTPDDAGREAIWLRAEADAGRIVEDHWDIIRALADDIQVPGRSVDSRHPALSGIKAAAR